MLELLVTAVLGIGLGCVSSYLFYFKERINEITSDLADKKAIIAALANHSEDLEKQNVKKLLKGSAKKTSTDVKVKKTKTTKK
jgi:hypothetical protein